MLHGGSHISLWAFSQTTFPYTRTSRGKCTCSQTPTSAYINCSHTSTFHTLTKIHMSGFFTCAEHGMPDRYTTQNEHKRVRKTHGSFTTARKMEHFECWQVHCQSNRETTEPFVICRRRVTCRRQVCVLQAFSRHVPQLLLHIRRLV